MAEILYVFQASGQEDVVSAFQTIQKSAEQSGAVVERSYERGERAAKKQADVSKMTAEQARAELKSIRDKENDDILRSVAKRIAAEKKAAEKISQIRKKNNEETNNFIARSMSNMLSGALSSVGNAVVSIGASALNYGAQAVGTAFKESFGLQDASRRVAINARGAGEDMVDPNKLRKEFEDTAIKTPGIKSEDIASAAGKYVDLTGDLQAARENMQSFATVASATGAKIDDVATAAAVLGSKFDVKSVSDMQKVMATLTFQGKGNALMMKDLAAQFQKLAAAGSAFGIGTGAGAVAKLGGLMQVARMGTRSSQSAGTAVENIFKQLTAKPQLAKYVFDKAGHKKDIGAIMADVVSGVGGGNLKTKEQQLSKLFGAQGYRGLTPLLGAYRKDYEDAGGGKAGEEAGRAAVVEMLRKATEATSDFAEVERDAAAAQQSAGAQIDAAWESIKQSMTTTLMPLIETNMPKLLNAVPALVVTLEQLGTSAAGLAKSLGILREKTHLQRAMDLEEKAAKAKTPEERDALMAQARVEHEKSLGKEGMVEREREEQDKFIKEMTKAGGGGVASRLFAENAAQVAEGRSALPGSEMFGVSPKLAEAGLKSTMNDQQRQIYEQYQATHSSLFGGDNGEVKKAQTMGGLVSAEGDSATKTAEANEIVRNMAQQMTLVANKLGTAADKLNTKTTILGK